jgi:hypothetical protein
LSLLIPKQEIVRDRKYLDAQHGLRCLFTGSQSGDHGSVVPCHIGTLGRGIKSSDDETLPLWWIFNATRNPVGYQPEWRSEIEMLRLCPPDDIVLRAYRALGRELYQAYRASKGR